MTLPIGLHLDVPMDVYHADPCERPSLSRSIACTLTAQSPAHAYLEHPRLGGGGSDVGTSISERGEVVHDILLGASDRFVAVEADDWRTKAAKESRAAIRADGKVPVLARVLEDCRTTAKKLSTNLHFDGGAKEATAVWASGDGVLCRARLDQWNPGEARIVDLKTCDNAKVSASASNMIHNGLDIQWAAYSEAMGSLFPDLAGRLSFWFVFAEVRPPYAMMVVEPAGSLQQLGRMKWARAVATWGRCLRDNVWPGYPADVQRVEAPAWALTEEMMTGGDDDKDF